MAYQETSSTGWFGRIGNAIKGMLFGLLLIPVSLILLVMNERNAVQDIEANKEIGTSVASIPNDSIDSSNEKRLVHLNGQAETADVLVNEQFGIEENAIRISWKSEIYQWEESTTSETKKKLGGGEETVTTYEYTKKWSPEPIDSSAFKEAGHENITTTNFSNGSIHAETVTLGAFQLPPGLVQQMDWESPLPLGTLPEAIEENGSVSNGVFYTGDPESPMIGDEKVEFSITRPGPVSVMAVQAGNSFVPYMAKNGKEKFLLYQGLLSAEQVIQGEESKAAFLRWILRAAGVILLWIGFVLLSKPLSVVADVVPIFGSLVGFLTGGVSFLLASGISVVVIAISWITFRPVLGIGLLVVAAAVLFFMMRLRKKKAIPATA